LPYDDIAASIRTRHVATSLANALKFNDDAKQSDVFSALTANSYDFAPVVSSGGVIGRIARSHLSSTGTNPVTPHVERLRDGLLISADAPLRSLMRALQVSSFLLVLEGTEVTALVTPWDLNKEASRAYFYILLTDLEIGLANATRASYPDQQVAVDLLKSVRKQKIKDSFHRLAPDERTDLVACMIFEDILDVVGATATIRSAYGIPDADQFRAAAKRLARIRNAVSHPVRTVLTDAGGLPELIAVEDELRRLVLAGRSGR
jgi:hypothetical protein